MLPCSQTALRPQPSTNFVARAVVRVSSRCSRTASVSRSTSTRLSRPSTTAREPRAASPGEANLETPVGVAGAVAPAVIPGIATVRTEPSPPITASCTGPIPSRRASSVSTLPPAGIAPIAVPASCSRRSTFRAVGSTTTTSGRTPPSTRTSRRGVAHTPLKTEPLPSQSSPSCRRVRSRTKRRRPSAPPPIAATAPSGETAAMSAGAPPTFSTAGPTGRKRRRRDPAELAAARLPLDGEHAEPGCDAVAVPTSAAARSSPVSKRFIRDVPRIGWLEV